MPCFDSKGIGEMVGDWVGETDVQNSISGLGFSTSHVNLLLTGKWLALTFTAILVRIRPVQHLTFSLEIIFVVVDDVKEKTMEKMKMTKTA